jgi:hypothetical protein
MTTAEKLFHEIGAGIEASTQSQMFGWPCYKKGKKAFISFEGNCMIFKLPANDAEEALKLKGAFIFMPNKKTPMKNWVCIPWQHKKKWKSCAEVSEKFILQ